MSQAAVLVMLEELGGLPGVRGALIATSDGAYAEGRRSGLDSVVANDVARTIRRMMVASATVGAPLEELTISFGSAQILVLPLREDATLAIVIERASAISAVRSLLRTQSTALKALLGVDDASTPDVSGAWSNDLEDGDDVDRLFASALGPPLQRMGNAYIGQAARAGVPQAQALAVVREQMREWLLVCEPSPSTLSVLVDNLAQTLASLPELRRAFTNDAQTLLKALPTSQ